MKEIRDIIKFATKAPSGHNAQPWKFKIFEDIVEIFPDYARALPIVDSNYRELFISLGCVLENFVLAAKAQGLNCEVNIFPSGSEVIRVKLNKTDSSDASWIKFIENRQSNRSKYSGKQIPSKDLDELRDVEKESGVSATFITDKNTINKLIETVKAANDLQMADRAFKDELQSWMRFNKREIEKRGDGLTYQVMGFPALPFRWLGKLIVQFFLKSERQNTKDVALINSASALVVFSTQDNNKESWIRLGRYLERLVLVATKLGISNSHFNQPFEIVELAKKVTEIGVVNGYPCLMIRLGYAKPMPFSPRRPVEELINNKEFSDKEENL